MMGEVKQRAVLWDANTGRRLATFEGKGTRGGHCLRFSPDGQQLITAAGDGTVQVWDVATRTEVRSFRADLPLAPSTSECSFSADGNRVVLAARDLKPQVAWVRVLDVAAGREVRSFKLANEAVREAILSPDGKHLAYNGRNSAVRLLNVDTGMEVRTIPPVE